MRYDGRRVRVCIKFNPQFGRDPREVGCVPYLQQYLEQQGVNIDLTIGRGEYQSPPMAKSRAQGVLHRLEGTSLQPRLAWTRRSRASVHA